MSVSQSATSEKPVPEDGSRQIPAVEGDEYPQGIKVAFVVLGLIMCLFLVSWSSLTAPCEC